MFFQNNVRAQDRVLKCRDLDPGSKILSPKESGMNPGTNKVGAEKSGLNLRSRYFGTTGPRSRAHL